MTDVGFDFEVEMDVAVGFELAVVVDDDVVSGLSVVDAFVVLFVVVVDVVVVAATGAGSCVGATAEAAVLLGDSQGACLAVVVAGGRFRDRRMHLSGGWCGAYLMLLPVASNVVHGVHTPGSMAVTVGNGRCSGGGVDVGRCWRIGVGTAM